MQITIINDCLDQNAKLRQVSRAGSLFINSTVNCFGARTEFEAAGFLVDAIDAFEGREGIIIMNIAPRGENRKKWKNGTPFGFFWHKKTLILSSIGGGALSLVKKIGVIENLQILDIEEVMDSISVEILDENTKNRITNSQFRSFDFLPRAAFWINKGMNIPSKKFDIDNIENADGRIWFIDNFGNIKTTLTNKDIRDRCNRVELKIGNKIIYLCLYGKLADIPNNSVGLVIGSSGINDTRFLEIISQSSNAAEKLRVRAGDRVEIISQGTF